MLDQLLAQILSEDISDETAFSGPQGSSVHVKDGHVVFRVPLAACEEMAALPPATWLRSVRQSHALTLTEVSKRTGVSISTLSLTENRRRKPHTKTLRSLSELYGISFVKVLAWAHADEK